MNASSVERGRSRGSFVDFAVDGLDSVIVMVSNLSSAAGCRLNLKLPLGVPVCSYHRKLNDVRGV